jgi:hypothetical protein
MAEMLGNVELIMWNLPETRAEKPTLDRVRAALITEHMPKDRAADIPVSTAFRRAADDLRDKTTLVRAFDRKIAGADDKELCVQVDRETWSEARHSLVREKVGVYGLNVETGPYTSNGDCPDTLSVLRAAYSLACVTYTWSDCSKVIQECLRSDGLGAYSPRRAGGVYFAPVSSNARDLLDRLERFSSSLGIRFLRYAVPDTDSQKAEIADAISTSLAAEIQAHCDAVGAYHNETRPGIMSNRGEMITATESLCNRLANLLSDRLAGLLASIATVRIALAEKESAAAQSNSIPGGRRIVQGVNPIP